MGSSPIVPPSVKALVRWHASRLTTQPSPVLCISPRGAPGDGPAGGGSRLLSWSAAGAFAAAVGNTVAVKVPINLATARWDAEHPPEDWERTRHRWEVVQAVRSWLMLAGFVLVSAAATT